MTSKLISIKQDLTYLEWSKTRNSSGTVGSFLKAFSVDNNKKTYYKLSNYDSIKGIIGHECVNELIVARLLEILGVEHLSYDLIYADIVVNNIKCETYLCASLDYKKNGEQKIALDTFYELKKTNNEKPLDFCKRMKWEKIYMK